MSEKLAVQKIIHPEVARKLLHIVASIAAGLSVLWISDIIYLRIISILAVLLTFVLVKYDFLSGIHRQRKSWGVFFLSLGFCFQIFMFVDSYPWIVFISMLIVGFADSMGALAGTFFPRGSFSLTGDRKTLTGTAVFFISSLIILLSAPFYLNGNASLSLPEMSFSYLLLSAVIISIILAAVEAISSLGSDNLFLLIFAPVLLFAFLRVPDNNLLFNFSVGIALAAIVAFISNKLRFLTANGSSATFLLAGFIFGFGGWKWSLPIMTFFVLSSLLSKYRKAKNKEIELYFEKSGTRDYRQVLANGGIGGILVILNLFLNLDLLYYLYLASLAAVCADTWATEIGTLSQSATYNVITFKPVEQGISGGISVKGTLGAFAGAFVISLSGFYWNDLNFIVYFGVIILAGIVGSFFDSVLGATIQHQRKCNICEKVTERHIHCDKPSVYYKGVKWIDNDTVNLFAGVFGLAIVLLISRFLLV